MRRHQEWDEEAEDTGGQRAAVHHGGVVDLERLHGGCGGLHTDPAALDAPRGSAAAALLEVRNVEDAPTGGARTPEVEERPRGPEAEGRAGGRGQGRERPREPAGGKGRLPPSPSAVQLD